MLKAMLPHAAIRQTILADSPLSYWPLDEASGSAVDVVAGRNGTITGSVTRPSSPTMADGAGAGFSGSGQRVDIADAAVWDYTGDWTAECFAYLSSLPGAERIAFCRSAGTAASQRWSLGITAGNKPTAFIADGSTYRVPTGAADWPTGRWCHIAVVRESGTARLYFAGSQVASNAGAVTSASAEQLTIGSMSHNYGPWPGLVAHAVVHTTALSAARIAARTIAAGL